jgi:hypothetical protein
MNSKWAFVLAGWWFLAAAAFAQTINHALFTRVLSRHVAQGGVDYAAIREDKRFEEYLVALGKVEPGAMKDEKERLAFWVNAYNAFTIKLILDHYPVKSIRDITQGETGPWDIVWIEIGRKKFSLNQIEHAIIRKEFDDPRIHAALVCAAKSCPPLRSEAYTAQRLDAQLRDNMIVFLRDTSKNRYDTATNTLYLSELFHWYGGDFVQQHGSAAAYVLKELGVTPSSSPTIQYLTYDWSLNSKP